MNHPAMPPVDAPRPPERPKSVDTAVQLVVAGTVIGAVGSLITVLDDEFAQALVRDAAPEATPEEADLLLSVVPVAAVLGVLITVGVFALLALKIRAGRNWARAVLAGLTAFSLIRFLSAAAQTNAELSLMWSLADLACSAAAVVYLFHKTSSEYFLAHMRKRR